MKKKTLYNKRTITIVLVVILATIVIVSIGIAICMWWGCPHPVVNSPEPLADTVYMLSPYKYRQKGKKPRKWNREIYCSDMDSVTVINWDFLTTKEKIDAITEAFIFELDDSVWDEYTEEEKLKILLDNSDVEWLH